MSSLSSMIFFLYLHTVVLSLSHSEEGFVVHVHQWPCLPSSCPSVPFCSTPSVHCALHLLLESLPCLLSPSLFSIHISLLSCSPSPQSLSMVCFRWQAEPLLFTFDSPSLLSPRMILSLKRTSIVPSLSLHPRYRRPPPSFPPFFLTICLVCKQNNNTLPTAHITRLTCSSKRQFNQLIIIRIIVLVVLIHYNFFTITHPRPMVDGRLHFGTFLIRSQGSFTQGSSTVQRREMKSFRCK